MKKYINGQSAAKLLRDSLEFYEEGSTTIPRKGSKIEEILFEKPDIKIYQVFQENRFKFEVNNCIYFLIHLKRPYIYIGSTKNLTKRLQKHRRSIVEKNHFSKFLQNVVNKEGKEFLYVGVLEDNIDINKLESLEENWIIKCDSFKNGYNSTLNTKRNLLTDEVKLKNKLKQQKRIVAFDLKGNKVKEFESVAEAAKKVNTQTTNISKCCNKQIRWIKNFIFRYKKDVGEELKILPLESNRGTLNKEHLNKVTELTSKRVKAVINGKQVIYNSISECERQNNIPRGTLGKSIKYKRHYKGILVEFYEDIV